MKILFIGFWGLDDPLTLSTTFPNLQLLAELSTIELICFATVERDGQPIPILNLPFTTDKISHQPLVSHPKKSLLGTKLEEFLRFPRELEATIHKLDIDVIIGRGAMAGALAYLTSKRTGKPFYVESFEPHAAYMLESGVWSKYDPRYIFQRFWESKEKKYARGLMPVAENYRRQLQREGLDIKNIITVPCPVNLTDFAPNEVTRKAVRDRLGFAEDNIIGIYVGKFGDIYYDQEAFELFRTAADYFGKSFRLVILTPNSLTEVRRKLHDVGLYEGHYFATRAPHHEVADYLSAADFAFAPIKPADCRQYCSPVKVGEYWASGLPVLLTEGVGDDSDIIKLEGGGAIFNLRYPDSVPRALQEIAHQIKQPAYRKKIRQLAERHRSIGLSRNAYNHFFGIKTDV
jgi:glycosyltransferase involved in cell wall biosynthesis